MVYNLGGSNGLNIYQILVDNLFFKNKRLSTYGSQVKQQNIRRLHMSYFMKKCNRVSAVKQFGLLNVSFLILVFLFCRYSYAGKSQGHQVNHYDQISYEKDKAQGQMLGEHRVVLDENGKLLPWTSYTNVINWSMNFIKNCPTEPTKFGDDPWYLITSVFNEDCTFRRNQNNMASDVYWAVETLKKYYAYSGDREPFYAVKLLLDRVIDYHTPWDWAWPNVPRTADDSPDGEYTDNWAGVDKMCMAAVGYLNFYKLTGEKKYLDAAMGVAETVARHIREGDERHSPVLFRVDLRTGKVLDPYTANMVYVVMLLEGLARMDDKVEGRIYYGGGGIFKQKRRVLWKWIFDYPMKNNMWSGYYEDVGLNRECNPKGHENDLDSGYYNLNQQIPMETARYILQNPKLDRDHKEHVSALIKWVENRFGKTKHYGATSIREQDQCFSEMGSHTARYASVVARWFGVTEDPKDREEARAAFDKYVIFSTPPL